MFLVMETKGKNRLQGESGQQNRRECGPGLACVYGVRNGAGPAAGQQGVGYPLKTSDGKRKVWTGQEKTLLSVCFGGRGDWGEGRPGVLGSLLQHFVGG